MLKVHFLAFFVILATFYLGATKAELPAHCFIDDAVAATILVDNPSGYYRLNEFTYSQGLRNFADTGGIADGVYIGSPQLQQEGVIPPPSPPDASAEFNGVVLGIFRSGDGGAIPYLASQHQNDFTVELWANPFSLTLTRVAYSSRNGNTGIEIRTGLELNWACEIGTTNGAVIVTGLIAHSAVELFWSHVVCTYDSASKTLSLYLDGVISQSVTHTGTFLPNVGNPHYLARTSTGANEFSGRLDEVALFNYTLSAERIRAHWSSIFQYKIYHDLIGPIAYWRFEEELLSGQVINWGTGGDDLFLEPLIVPTTGIPLLTGALPGFSYIFTNNGLLNTGGTGLTSTYLSDGYKSLLNPPEDWTVVGWFEPLLSLFTGTVWSTYNCRLVGLSTVCSGARLEYVNGVWRVTLGDGDNTPVVLSTPAAGGFENVLVTYDQSISRATIYVDGQNRGQATVNFDRQTQTSVPFFVGGEAQLVGGFTGVIDEVSVFDVTFSDGRRTLWFWYRFMFN